MGDQESSEKLYGDRAGATPGGATPERLSPEDVLGATVYPPQRPRTALDQPYRDHADTVRIVLGLTSAEARAREDTLTAAITEARLEPYTVGKTLIDLATAADVRQQRGVDLTAAEIQALNEASREAIHDTYGERYAADLLARADKFVRAHPKLNALIAERVGIGSHPKLVAALVEHVRVTNFR